MIEVQFDLIHGIVFGIEHLTDDDYEHIDWIIPIHLGIFRVVFIRYKNK
jgi:hypothetical protein